MRIRFYILLVFVGLYSLLNSTTWHIKLDGTGNFTAIQEGIDASTDADTVLVYPGTYYENIIYNGKNITIASLEILTGDEQYIYNTIIDGQRLSSCVSIISEETDTCLQGFTITNGQGEDDYPLYGGGISIWGDSDLLVQCDIINCVITENYGHFSAGMIIKYGLVFLSGNSIRQNYSSSRGGGLAVMGHSQVTFDPVNRCSIYNNVASTGVEIFVETIHFDDLTVIVDTFTVAEPTRYFAQYYINEDFIYTFDILNHILVPVDHDLYVSPDGDDTNSGLTPEDPLKTINLAVRNIASNSENPRTVHLAAGIYNKSQNQQHFAFGSKAYINIVGEDMDTTIIDGEDGFHPLLIIGPGYYNAEIKNLTFQNINYIVSSIWFTNSDSIRFENILIKNIVSNVAPAFAGATSSGNVQLKNVTVDNTESTQHGGTAGAAFNGTTYFKAEDCTFSNNVISQNSPSSAGLFVISNGDIIIENCKFFGNSTTSNLYEGSASALFIGDYNDVQGDVIINNCLFYDNVNVGGKSTIYARVLENGTMQFNNNTLINNESVYGCLFKGDIEFRNNILRNMGDYEIALFRETSSGLNGEIDISYNNILGGEEAIYNQSGVINWLEGNIDEDPLFLLTGENPYQLTLGSPCVDTGTPDTTGLFLPPWDLLNNHRVWDGDGDGTTIIDMGCYEFSAEPYVGIINEQLPISMYNLTNYPNPFNPETKIVFDLPESGQVILEIYNIKGQKVKTLLDCYMCLGRSEMLWNSKDDNGKRVSSGVYFYRLQTPTKILSKKMLLLK